MSFLVTDTGFFEYMYLFLNSQYSRLCQKTTKNTGKHDAERFFGSQNLKIKKHTQQRIAHYIREYT